MSDPRTTVPTGTMGPAGNPGHPQAVSEDSTSAWARTAWWSGAVSAGAFVLATALVVAQGLDAFGAAPDYVETERGQLADEADFFAALFAHNDGLTAAVVVAETAFAVAFLALIPLLAAAARLSRSRHPAPWLALGFGTVAGTLVAVRSALALVAVPYWQPGWAEVPDEIVVAVGRGLDQQDQAALGMFQAAFAVTAVMLAYLAAACRREAALPVRLTSVCLLGAAALIVLTVLDLVNTPTDTLELVLSGLVGGVIAPLVAAGLGLHLRRLGH